MKDFILANKSRWLLPFSAVFSLILLIVYALELIGGGEKILPGVTPAPVTKVPANANTLVVGRQRADNAQLWPGVIRSKTVAGIAPKLTARIISVNVNSGDKVKKGAVIARLDDRELRSAYNETHAALTAAKAVAARARADLKRSQYLYDQEAATRASHDAAVANAGSAQSAVNQAASSVEKLRANLTETILTSPFDGVISERLKEAGDIGLPGDPVAILLNPDDLRLEVAIPNSCKNRIKVGLPVLVRVDTLPGSLQATIDEIAPEIDRQTGMQMVKAALPVSAGLKHGQFAWLEQGCESGRDLIFIPITAVIHYGQMEAVKIVENKQVYSRHIRTGKQQGASVEVLSGLRPGETIITNSGIGFEPIGAGK